MHGYSPLVFITPGPNYLLCNGFLWVSHCLVLVCNGCLCAICVCIGFPMCCYSLFNWLLMVLVGVYVLLVVLVLLILLFCILFSNSFTSLLLLLYSYVFSMRL